MSARLLSLALSLPMIAFSPTTEAASSSQPVAEIVTYRLNAGVSQEDHLSAANATRAFLNETGSVITRTLSVDETGLWTDHIIWTSLEAAKAAEAQAMQRPEFGVFFSGMDETSVSLRHTTILMQME